MMMCLFLSSSYSTLYNDFSRISPFLRVFLAQLDATLAGPPFKMCIFQDFLAARVIRGPACIFFLSALSDPMCVTRYVPLAPSDFCLWYEEIFVSTRNELLYGCLRGAGGFFGGNVRNAALLSISTL